MNSRSLADVLGTLVITCAVFGGADVLAQTPSSNPTLPTCKPDSKYDAVLSSAMPPDEKTCRIQWYEWSQDVCSDATYKGDWKRFVDRRRQQLDEYQKAFDKMEGGNALSNLVAIKDYMESGHLALERKEVAEPSRCVLKRRTVANEATDFSPIGNHLSLWALAHGRLLATDNRRAYAAEAQCERKQIIYSFQRAEQALDLIKKSPSPPKNC